MPVAVHGGKLRRDVLQHICRRAALSITEEDDDVIEAAGEVPPHALPEEHAAEPFVKAPAERRWVETSAAEQVEIAARDLRIEEHHCDEVAQYKRIVHEAQLHLVLGDYAAVESALVPMLGDEGRFEQLASLLGYEILGDALFFFSTAAVRLATDGGEADFSSREQQQRVVRAFQVCKRLLERFRERREEARSLLRSLLSRAYLTYMTRLMKLVWSQKAEEFKDSDLVGHAMRGLQRALAHKASSPGDRVRIDGLVSKPEINGRLGLVQAYDSSKARYAVLVDGVAKPMLLKQANLTVEEDDDAPLPGSDALLIGSLGPKLDRINASVLCGFSFIVALARSEKQLNLLSAGASANLMRSSEMQEGILGVSRAAIVHYERGHLRNGLDTFKAVDALCTEGASALAENDAMADSLLPQGRAGFGAGSGAVGVGYATSEQLRCLSQAVIRMYPAQELAASKLHWARTFGFDETMAGSVPMREGWSPVFAAAKACGCACAPLPWEELCAFMFHFFEGFEYVCEHAEQLSTGTAALFVRDSLVDPVRYPGSTAPFPQPLHHSPLTWQVRMVVHQCEQLEARSELLRRAEAESQRSTRAGRPMDTSDPAWTALEEEPMRCARLQLVTMLTWLVRLRGLYHRVDGLLRFCMRMDAHGASMGRFYLFHTAICHVGSLLASCCALRPRSTLVDLLERTSRFSRVLDYYAYKDLCGKEIAKLKPNFDLHPLQAQFLLELVKDDLPEYLKWFATDAERKRLSVVFGLSTELMGFDLRHPDIADKHTKIRDGTHSGRFCVFAMEGIELLHQLGERKPTWDEAAGAMLTSAGLGVSRQERRRPEVQKRARRLCQVVELLCTRFPPADLVDMCARRKRHYGALNAIFGKSLEALRVATPAATRELSIGRLKTMGGLMTQWTSHDLYEINLHVLALAELATEVNVRVRLAFGSNFPCLVWLSDCFEFEPAHAHKDMMLIGENERLLFETVCMLRSLSDTGVLPSKADTEPAGALAVAATPAAPPVDISGAAPVSPSAAPGSARRGKAKGKGKRK